MTSPAVKTSTQPKRLKPIKKSTQAVRAKKRRSKRIVAAPAKADGQPTHGLNVTTQSARPLASFVGLWADDETFAEFTAAMATYRRTIDADARQP
jgi:hypothetical protein